MRRAVLVAGAVVAGAVVVGVPLALTASSAHSNANPTAPVATSTAAVVRTDLSTTIQLAGTLGFAGAYDVVNESAGRAITALPAAGDVVARGAPLYEVDGVGIPLLYGTRPMWRDLGTGVTPGPDVAQLNDNLIALGFTDDGLVAGDVFTWQTATAVEEWQRARGVPVTRVVQVGDVVFAPGPLRVATVVAALGAPPQPGAVIIHGTSPTPDVDVQLSVAQEYLVHAGDTVGITLPDGRSTTDGTVSAIGSVASAPSGGSGGPGPASGPGASGDQSDTVDVTVALSDPSKAAGFTSAAVVVNVTSAHVHQVLAVPINALLALAEGGYGVEVVDRNGHHLVGVHTGLFANTLVEVNGAGLAPGTRVEVPSS
jgi:peptidoglycan hydrolase-like protein with peptidoglycan-binding domain